MGSADDYEQASLSALQRIAAACDRFHHEWLQGRRPRIEDFLADCLPRDRSRLEQKLVALDTELRQCEATTAEFHFDPLRLVIVPLALGAVSYIPILLCLTSMRARNGYRGWHERLSGTRVVALRLHVRDAARQPLEGRKPAADPRPTRDFGPYRVVAARVSTPQLELFDAQDTLLQRQVWILVRPREVVIDNTARERVARPTRPRWLQGGIEGAKRWDALEASPGSSLADLLEQGHRFSWEAARVILLHLAQELSAASTDGTLPETLSLDHVWIDKAGRAKLLDQPLRAVPSDAAVFDAHSGTQHATAQLYMAVVERCHACSVWPSHAEEFIDELRERSESPDLLAWATGQLSRLLERPATLHWDDRLGLTCISLATELWIYPSLILLLGMLIGRWMAISEGARLAIHLPLCLALPAIVAFIGRGGPVFRLLHVEVRAAAGGKASRWRCAWRDFWAWLPWTLGWGMTASAVGWASTRLVAGAADAVDPRQFSVFMFFLCGGALPAVFLILGGICALRRPERGLQDRLARTCLVYE